MTTIAIIGAGPGVGMAVAQRFGREGFAVALISRNRAHGDRLADTLRTQGITAAAYAADVRDREALASALRSAADELGAIEVLQYSPSVQSEFLKPLAETTIDDLVAATEFSIYGPLVAVNEVTPGMAVLGRGTILFVNGASAITPNPKVAGTSIAFAGEAAYATMLHDTLAERGIYVGQLIVPGAITPNDPVYAPVRLADRLWQMHTGRDTFRVVVGHTD